MIDLFKFSEPDENDKIFKIYPKLKIASSPAFYIILRGIIGTINITQTFRNKTFYQQVDFLSRNYIPQASIQVDNKNEKINDKLETGISAVIEITKIKCKSNLEILPKYISDSFTLKDLSDVLSNKVAIHRNKAFFESLNNEFCNFYYHTNNCNHTVAFLHLYRILEYVSYTFPVMYTASTKDFSKSFDALKALFNGDKDQGELKVFRYFIKHVMSVEKDYEKLSIDINIVSDLAEYNDRMYKTIVDICDPVIFNPDRNISNSKLSVKFSEFSSFIITIRNRFFHLKNSQSDNIHSVDIVDSDYFFSLINRKCAYFISLITLVVIKKSYFQK